MTSALKKFEQSEGWPKFSGLTLCKGTKGSSKKTPPTPTHPLHLKFFSAIDFPLLQVGNKIESTLSFFPLCCLLYTHPRSVSLFFTLISYFSACIFRGSDLIYLLGFGELNGVLKFLLSARKNRLTTGL